VAVSGWRSAPGAALNEHILGTSWPEVAVRLEMLEEALQLIRQLFTGEQISHRGKHYTVENARRYTLPDEPVPIDVPAFGPQAAEVWARIGDGLITMMPDAALVERFRRAGGGTKPVNGGLTVRWGTDTGSRRCPRTPLTTCGPMSSRPANSRISCRPRATSGRRPSWSPRTRWRQPYRAVTIRTPTWRP